MADQENTVQTGVEDMNSIMDRVEDKVKSLFEEGQTALQDILDAVQRHTVSGNSEAVSYGVEGDKSIERLIRAVEMQLIDPKDGGVQKNSKDMLEQCERTVQMVALLKFGPRAIIDKNALKSLFR